MLSHEFAALLLSGPNLPIVVPPLADSDETFAPVVIQVAGQNTADDSLCELLMITRAAWSLPVASRLASS